MKTGLHNTMSGSLELVSLPGDRRAWFLFGRSN
jgi:hypothetical protein